MADQLSLLEMGDASAPPARADLAQLVEQRPCKATVPGPTPRVGSAVTSALSRGNVDTPMAVDAARIAKAVTKYYGDEAAKVLRMAADVAEVEARS